MILIMPNPIFAILYRIFGLFPPSEYLISPGQLDLLEGRKTMVDWHFAELYEVSILYNIYMLITTLNKAGKRHSYDAEVIGLVLKKIKDLEVNLDVKKESLGNTIAEPVRPIGMPTR